MKEIKTKWYIMMNSLSDYKNEHEKGWVGYMLKDETKERDRRDQREKE